MAATKSAGRVSIRVVPDSTRFKEDLDKSLKRIERTMVAKIQAELVLSRESLAKLKRQIESLVVKIKPTIELNISPSDIEELKAKIEAMKPKVDVELETAAASRRIAAFTREREMNVRVRMLGLNGLAAKLGAMSGFNVLADTFRAGGQFLENLDRHAVKIGQMATLISGAVSGIVGLIGGVGLLGNDLASLGNLALLGPAFFTGTGIAIGIMVAAFKDMKTVLADLGPKMSAFQDSISADFWKEAAGPIRDMTNYLLPLLHTTDGTTNTARSLGQFVGEIATSVKELLTADKLNLMFDRMNRSIDILKGAVRPLTNSFINLGIVGSGYFERFSTWIVKLSNQFDAFITRSAENGDLDRWIENAITGFKNTGRALSGITGMLGSIGRAAERAGYGGLSEFADAMQRIDEVMNGERFQAGLAGIFAGVLPALRGIKNGFLNLGPAVESAIPSFQRVMVTFGSIFEQLLGFVGQFISNPDLQKGFENFVTGIDDALKKLEPAIAPLTTSLGGVLTLMGDVLERVGGLVADMAIKLGPEFDKILVAITPLLDPLNKLASNLIDKLQPVLAVLAEKVLPPLVTALSQVFPWIDKIVNIISPLAVSLLSQFGDGMKKFLDSLDIDQATVDRFSGLMDRVAKSLEDQNKFKFDPDFGEGGSLGTTIAAKLALALGTESVMAREIGKWFEKQTEQVKAAGHVVKFLTEVGKNFTNPANWSQLILDIIVGVTKFFTDLGTALDKAFTAAEIIIKKKFQEWFKSTFGFGASGKGVKPGNVTIGPGGGGVGMAPGAKIAPNIFDEESEKSWITTFMTNVGTHLDTSKTGLVTNLATWAAAAQPTWDAFWNGLNAKTSTSSAEMPVTTAANLVVMGQKMDTFQTESNTHWASFWVDVGAKLVTGWTQMNTDSASHLGTILGTVVNGVNAIKPGFETSWNAIKAVIPPAFVDMQTSANRGVASVAVEVGTLGAKALAAIGDLSQTLAPSGKALVAGFAAGMNANQSLVTSAAIGLAAAVSKYMPHSPAKVGPLSGNGYTTHSGRALVKDFAGGMMDNMNLVRKSTEAVANAANIGANMDLMPDLDNNGIVIDRSQLTIQTYNPVAEPTSRTIEKSANTLRMAKAI